MIFALWLRSWLGVKAGHEADELNESQRPTAPSRFMRRGYTGSVLERQRPTKTYSYKLASDPFAPTGVVFGGR